MVFDEFHFRYGDFESRQFGIIIAHMDTSSFDSMIGETETSTVFNRRNNRSYFLEDRYESSPIQTEIEMFLDDDHEHFILNERREFENAVFYSQTYKPFYIDLHDDRYGDTYDIVDGYPVMSYLNARFINPSRIEDGDGKTFGYKCTLECDGPLFHQDPITQYGNMSLPFITLTTDSDTPEYIYPKITIQVGSSGGTITLYNASDNEDRKTTFEDVTAGEEIVIDSEINYISGDNYSKFSVKNFPRLISGENYIYHEGDIESITIEYSNRRYL